MQALKSLLQILVLILLNSCSNDSYNFNYANSTGCKVMTFDSTVTASFPIPPATAVKWSGECKDGYANGKGSVVVLNKENTIYFGNVSYKDGKLNSYCEINYVNDGEFKGTYKDGEKMVREFTQCFQVINI